MALVAVVHVTEASQAMLGALCTVVAVAGSVLAPAVVNVVDVAVMFQPVPDPVPSPMSIACVWVVVWSAPFSAAENVMFGGAETKASEPAVSVAVAVAAPAVGAPTAEVVANAASAAASLRIWVFFTVSLLEGGRLAAEPSRLHARPLALRPHLAVGLP